MYFKAQNDPKSLFSDDPPTIIFADPYILVLWPQNENLPYKIFDVFSRDVIQSGSVRALPQHRLIGLTTNIKWSPGKFHEGLILMTGFQI